MRTIVVAMLLLSASILAARAQAVVLTPQSRVQYLMALVRCIDAFKDAQKRELVLCAQKLAQNLKNVPKLPERKN